MKATLEQWKNEMLEKAAHMGCNRYELKTESNGTVKIHTLRMLKNKTERDSFTMVEFC